MNTGKHLLSLIATLLLCLLVGPQALLSAAGVPVGKPNVILVLTDHQGSGDLSVTGNPILKTPNMDQLAREGVQLTNFHVNCFFTRAIHVKDRLAKNTDVTRILSPSSKVCASKTTVPSFPI